MDELFYSPFDLAEVIIDLNLRSQETAAFLEKIWENERYFLQERYRENKRELIRQTMSRLTFLRDKSTMRNEFKAVQRDFRADGREIFIDAYSENLKNLNLFFKSVRLRILYAGGKDFVKIKRKALMKHYGYKRISGILLKHFYRCIYFYHLQTYSRNRVKYPIEGFKPNEMIVFRIA